MDTVNDQKGPSLKKRLDNLESELKRLHDKIVQRRSQKLDRSYDPGNKVALVNVHTNPYSLTNKSEKTNEDGKDWYTCLKSITRSIAQGSDAIRRIASMTDITSANETLSSLMPLTTNHPTKSNSDFSAFEKTHHSKGVVLSRSDGGISNLESSSRSPRLKYKSLQECKKNLLRENQNLRKQVSLSQGFHEEMENLKKKLKDETKKRQIAEKKVTEVSNGVHQIQTIQSIEHLLWNKPKTTNSVCVNTSVGVHYQPPPEPSVRKITSDELPLESRRSLIEKKYVEEREKRIELEGIVAQFREELNMKNKECAEVTVGQKLALALAEQFRAKYEKGSKGDVSDGESYLMKALKDSTKECLKLKEELSMKHNTQELNSNNDFKQRAIKAESELRSLHKKLNYVSNQNPLDTTIVQDVLDRHKRAYSELLLAKKCSDAEYKARCRRLEGEVARLHSNYEKRIEVLNDRTKELTLQLQEKLIYIDGIAKTKGDCDVSSLTKMLSEINVQTSQREAIIESLNGTITEKEMHLKRLVQERDDMMEKLTKIQNAMAELQHELENKNGDVSKLLCQMEEKSDVIAIKEKILTDQSETITMLRKTLNDNKKSNVLEREEFINQIKNLQEDKVRLLSDINGMTQTIMETEKFREGQEKNMFLLQQLEKQVYERQKEWEQQLSTMSMEKDQAILTAKFATQKLVTAVGEYESQLKAHKQLQHLLKASLQEKEQKLQQAANELEGINAQGRLDAQNGEVMKNDFHKKFKDVYKVCADVIDHYPDIATSSDFS